MQSGSKARRTVLRQLLAAGQPGTQVELVRALGERGHVATQSTVSRDLKILGAERLLREDGQLAYHLRAAAASGSGAGRFPGEMILAVHHNEAIIVVRTRVGRAPAVGLDLDALKHADVLGTVAGDDTVLVVPRSVSIIGRLANQIRELAGLPRV